jgi:hypothetical protein
MLSGCVTGRYTTVLAPAPNPDGHGQLILLDTASGKTWKSNDDDWIPMPRLDADADAEANEWLDQDERADAHCRRLSVAELKQLIVATRLRRLDLDRDFNQAQQRRDALRNVFDAFEEDDADGKEKDFDHEGHRKAYREYLEIELHLMELSAMAEWLGALDSAAEVVFEEKAMDLSSSPLPK